MNCIHGIEEFFCATCIEKKNRRIQKLPAKPAIAGLAKIKKLDTKFVVIHGRKIHPSHEKLGSDITHIHIQGQLTIKLLEKILRLCPNLIEIQLIPAFKHKITEVHNVVAHEQGVKIIFGHIRGPRKKVVRACG